MKIKISKSQWEGIGKVAGWNKTAQIYPNEICVWDWSERDGKYASDCDGLFSKKFTDQLKTDDTCPKCDKRVVRQGDEVELEEDTRNIDIPKPSQYISPLDRPNRV